MYINIIDAILSVNIFNDYVFKLNIFGLRVIACSGFEINFRKLPSNVIFNGLFSIL